MGPEGGGGGGDPLDPTNDPRKFDSTGMFHWCPEQPLSTCLVVSPATFDYIKDERKLRY